ncbi:ubiquitin-conjugating enzyme E2 34-like isoform X2 [Durio zibethinus]|uniref:Ubiquitin-conjugating enzyme E2 34-like isoform X2 n=1 Tax=Durio zibethinus TaxID=66656 RepID=A0A6P5XAN4_DURZI|nr:ubiquitin-conjugating enzyme E2 34-like isoform X2 [Durio zibethinus]
MRNNRLDAQLLGLEEWQRNFVLSAFRKNIEHFEPVSHVVAHPFPNDILEWHYVLEGSEGTPFAGGYYYVKIKFPPESPYKPTGIIMITPNGRFMTQKKICLSVSDFHSESWNPMCILTGLLFFMVRLCV